MNYDGESDSSDSKDLNEYQEVALADIKSSFEADKVTLLKGVTSSGKTEVYFKVLHNKSE